MGGAFDRRWDRVRMNAMRWSQMLKLSVAAIISLGLLGGCATVEGQAITAGVREMGKNEAAAALEGVDWYRCRASPVGAVMDKYAINGDAWTAYVVSCLGFWRSSPQRPPVGQPMTLAPEPIIPPTAYRTQPMPFQGPGI
jgi:hypothetical protein